MKHVVKKTLYGIVVFTWVMSVVGCDSTEPGVTPQTGGSGGTKTAGSTGSQGGAGAGTGMGGQAGSKTTGTDTTPLPGTGGRIVTSDGGSSGIDASTSGSGGRRGGGGDGGPSDSNRGTGGNPDGSGPSGTGGRPVINPGQCDSTASPVARHGKLSIKDGKLVNQCGRPVQFTSMSMYDWSQQGRQYYNATAVKNLLQDKKCASIRIPLLAGNYPGQYNRMKTVMDACIANGIYCIPNWHVIGNANVTNAKAFYVQLAKDYGDTPNIIYEPWNEPTGSSWSQIKAYMEEIIAAVRPIDPDGIFLAGTRQWCQQPAEACANPIDDPLVGYVFHFYAASHRLSGFQGGLNRCLTAKKLLWGTEYGGCSANGNGAVNETEVKAWWSYMDQNLISSNAWAIETNGETSSVFVGSASATGPWPDSQLTNWGRLVFAQIAKGYAITMSQ